LLTGKNESAGWGGAAEEKYVASERSERVVAGARKTKGRDRFRSVRFGAGAKILILKFFVE